MTHMINIALSQLIISPKNVRVVNPRKKEDAQLVASVRANGILQNLVVIAVEGKPDFYEVIAGGRRFAALTTLLNQGIIDGDYPVPCAIENEENATEISLSENIKASLHPADEFLAFKLMADEGKNVNDIASRFGRAKAEVKRLLKLGDVAPELIQHFRSGKIDLDCIMAFTVCTDHDRQLACYKELSRAYRLHSHSIKRFLLDEAIHAKSREAQFIGIHAYKKAGGAITTDLFSDESYWDSKVLVSQLIDEKLSKEAAPYKKDWAWVETSHLGYGAIDKYTKLTAKSVGAPTELEDTIADIEAQLAALNTLEEWTDDDEKAFYALEKQSLKLDKEKDSYLEFTQEQRELGGVIVTFDNQGQLLVFSGIVKPADKAKAVALENTALNSDDREQESNEIGSAVPAPIESKALQSDLQAYYQQAFQAHLLKHENTCFNLLAYSMACSFFQSVSHRGSIAQIQCQNQWLDAKDIDQTPAAETLKQAEISLNLTWLDINEDGPRFAAFQALSKKDKTAIMVFCIARSSVFGPGKTDHEHQANILSETQFKLSDYWLPNKDNYFSRIRRDDLLDIGESLTGESFSKNHKKLKKAELVSVINELPERKQWLPAVMSA